MLLFDIGFNEGNFTKAFLSYWNKEPVQVIGVDGHSGYVGRQVPSNIKLLNNVVTDKSNVLVPFYICDCNPGINSTNPEWMNAIRHKPYFDKTTRKISVVSITLDSLIALYGKPHTIKLDIEGGELAALRGLSQKSGSILFEWAEEYFSSAVQCVKRLQELGYTEFACEVCVEPGHASAELPYPTRNVQYNTSLVYDKWENLNIEKLIQPNRKLLWGMIYAK